MGWRTSESEFEKSRSVPTWVTLPPVRIASFLGLNPFLLLNLSLAPIIQGPECLHQLPHPFPLLTAFTLHCSHCPCHSFPKSPQKVPGAPLSPPGPLTCSVLLPVLGFILSFHPAISEFTPLPKAVLTPLLGVFSLLALNH